jgi:hypothetical protein
MAQRAIQEIAKLIGARTLACWMARSRRAMTNMGWRNSIQIGPSKKKGRDQKDRGPKPSE